MIRSILNRNAVAPYSPGLAASATLGRQPLEAEAEVITIRPTGFEPAEIKRDKGEFLLVVHNRSGVSEVVLRLDRETGARLHEVRVPRERLNWSTRDDLTPGRYALTEANHPNWVCHITITAR